MKITSEHSMRIILLMILLLLAFTIGGCSNLHTNSEIENNGCSATYKRFIFPRIGCNIITGGHCATTGLTKHNAQMEIGQCLCDKYESEPSAELGIEITSICDKYSAIFCNDAIEIAKEDICEANGIEPVDSVRCQEYFNNLNLSEVEMTELICKYKTAAFRKLSIR